MVNWASTHSALQASSPFSQRLVPFPDIVAIEGISGSSALPSSCSLINNRNPATISSAPLHRAPWQPKPFVSTEKISSLDTEELAGIDDGGDARAARHPELTPMERVEQWLTGFGRIFIDLP